ncbi:MAG: hypothetical protein E7258_08015, partial [Lachnospiraceae bacterium]|nr:hypothetical protein [Lachnospiraceae bacterium]
MMKTHTHKRRQKMKGKKGFIKGRILPIVMSVGLFFTSVMSGVGDVSLANEQVATDTDAGEVYESTYDSEGYSVTFKLDNKWETGYTATVTITNTGEETIENWCMSFPLEQGISNI